MATTLDAQTVISQVHLPTVMEALGIPLLTRGRQIYAHCWNGHPDKTPSVVVHENGTRGRGTFYCFACHHRGDAAQVVQDIQHLEFQESLEWLARNQGIMTGAAPRPRVAPVAYAAMPSHAQSAAAVALMDLLDQCPGSRQAGVDYLVGRGVDPSVLSDQAVYRIGRDDCVRIGRTIDQYPDREMFLDAGILKQNEQRTSLNWFDDVCIGFCRRRSGAPMYAWARRIDTTFLPHMKYLNQSVQHGARWMPYNLPAIRRARGATLRIVEGPITALASESLGTPTMSVLTRIGFPLNQVTEPDWNVHGPGPLHREMWDAIIPDLQQCRRVELVHDNDKDEGNRALNTRCAGHLAGWLRHHQVAAEVVTLPDLGLGAFKDFADATRARSDSPS